MHNELKDTVVLKLRGLNTRRSSNKTVQVNRYIKHRDHDVDEIVTMLYQLNHNNPNFITEWNEAHLNEFPINRLTGEDEDEGFVIQTNFGTIVV